ncbi:hypothetical protein AB0M11_26415 [Streptomyces sp. NPDC051987]|uniref:hypothetical protein n=1 Tax=Streptomyces sp. NPDC051987 TaxID=3155808 RepID=UPI0034354E0B
MTPLERLLAEELPTGTFGHALPPPQPGHRPPARWTPEEQAQHWADLGKALQGWHWQDDTSLSKKRRHLRLVRRAEAA